MAVCPNGHDSASDDFCDTCGIRIGGVQGTPPNPATGASSPVGAPPSAGTRERPETLVGAK